MSLAPAPAPAPAPAAAPGPAWPLAAGREARQPPEARGLARDGVRMMVAHRSTGGLVHTTFALLPRFLEPGDLVVVNTSGTIPAAVAATAVDDGAPVVIHLSTHLEGDLWVVEPRRPVGAGTERWPPGEPPPRRVAVPDGGRIELVERYRGSTRLWMAKLDLGRPALDWLASHGRPIHYAYVEQPWPLPAYQTVYATTPGSAEMPSAGRPFTPEVVTRLVAGGVGVTPVVLHTGVASQEAGEAPYPEWVDVPGSTAARVNLTRAAGGRVVAVGTTVVRALETAADGEGTVHPWRGWTDLVVTPERGVLAVDGLLTGWHEPAASHLLMLEALAGRELLERSYADAAAHGYLWHEFGDVHLLLP